jgi:hypothetical protein
VCVEKEYDNRILYINFKDCRYGIYIVIKKKKNIKIETENG